MELQFKNVTKEYGNVHAVEHVTHSMGKGVYGLLGVNGAGKTTLMRMICTAITPTSGDAGYPSPRVQSSAIRA